MCVRGIPSIGIFLVIVVRVVVIIIMSVVALFRVKMVQIRKIIYGPIGKR